MSPSNTDVINDLYAAFGRGDIPALLGMLDENIEWRAPDNLPHGGTFAGRDRVVVFARLSGRLRSTGEETGYSSAHAWTMRDGTPVRFDEYVDAPLALPHAG